MRISQSPATKKGGEPSPNNLEVKTDLPLTSPIFHSGGEKGPQPVRSQVSRLYATRYTVDLSELGGRLHKTEDDSFEILKRLCLRLLEASREDTRAGFQPMLGKVMVGESDKYASRPPTDISLI
jgi:hypothetical protein